ncbi:predicted ATPase [Candidatus Vecturithrix granuli]|uniref:Predicted ATPase n=1 Tax=Vecturithrix granuli TaxID=1499967 RepID=A0A081BZX4_VECG1|nr:predicted ATPase [Candidatus Vecturithrix granuli]
MAVAEMKKAVNGRQKSVQVFTTDFVCTVLKESGLIDNTIVAQIRQRESSQREMLQKQYGKNSITQITPVDVISAMGLKFNASGDGQKTSILTEEVIMKTLAAYWKLPFLKIEMSKISTSGITAKLSEPFARRHLIVPVLLSKTMLLVALVNPMDAEAMSVIQQTTPLKIRPVISTKADILRAIDKCYAARKTHEATQQNRNSFRSFIRAAMRELPDASNRGDSLLQLDASGEYEEKYIVNAVNLLLRYGYEQRASDIHIEPKQAHSTIRFRIDGLLQGFEKVPQGLHQNLVIRIKALAGMQIAEKRKPLDGTFRMKLDEKEIEFRVSTIPVVYGEKVMIRLLDPTMLLQPIDKLGFSEKEYEHYLSLISRHSGMILVTGPAGSGKTTTLYSTLNTLADRAINITTIEDPVELVHETFNQITVQPNVGLTFGTALRHIVRQSSDVIMVGEIRDQETAENAFKAALTGHLVLSTLHTNDAPSAIVRLADMGIQTSLLESALVAVVSQRLVRKICDLCGEPCIPSKREMDILQLSEEDLTGLPIRKGFGCPKCRETGYFGQTAVFEIMPISDEIRSLIHNHAPAHLIRQTAIKEGMKTLKDNAMDKFKAGIIPADEVLRVMGENLLNT